MNYEEFIKQAEIHCNAHEYPKAVVSATQAIDSDKTDGKEAYCCQA